MFRKAAVTGIAVAFCATTLSAQLTSDVVPRQRLVPREEQIRRDIEDSRFHLGAFRLQPQIFVRDLGYNNNVYGTPTDPISDWTATVSAGTKWTLPFGSKTYFRGTALPEYTWYADLADRRFLGGTYDASFLALFNRLSIEATAGTQKNLSIVSSEIEAPAIRQLDHVMLDVELDVLRRLSLFATARGQNQRYQSEGAEAGDLSRLGELDRDEQLVRAGVRYRFRSYLDFSVGAERTQSEFELHPSERDNISEAVVFGFHYDRPRMYTNLSVAAREGKPASGSTFEGYDTTTGSYFVSWSLVAPIEVQAYGHKRVVYGLFADNPYFFENRTGGALMFRLGERLALRAFGDVGDNEYPRLAIGTALPRVDDVVTVGGGFALRIYRSAALTVSVTQSDYDSNINGFDRSVVRIQSGISLGGFPR